MPRLHRSLLRRYRLFAPRLLRLGLLLLALLLLGDGVAALRIPQIQAALALSTPTPQQGALSLVAAPMSGSQIVLASDTFQRTDQAYLGEILQRPQLAGGRADGSQFRGISRIWSD